MRTPPPTGTRRIFAPRESRVPCLEICNPIIDVTDRCISEIRRRLSQNRETVRAEIVRGARVFAGSNVATRLNRHPPFREYSPLGLTWKCTSGYEVDDKKLFGDDGGEAEEIPLENMIPFKWSKPKFNKVKFK